MKKLTAFIILLFLLGGCNKEWHEDRRVSFSLTRDISFNQNDGVYSEFNWTVEYKIIGDPNADTSTVNVVDLTYKEEQWSHSTDYNFFNLLNHKLMSYDHLEFKVTTSFSTVKPINLELNLKAYTTFRHNTPDDRSITETLLIVNSPDTTIYFTWSPHNLPLH